SRCNVQSRRAELLYAITRFWPKQAKATARNGCDAEVVTTAGTGHNENSAGKRSPSVRGYGRIEVAAMVVRVSGRPQQGDQHRTPIVHCKTRDPIANGVARGRLHARHGRPRLTAITRVRDHNRTAASRLACKVETSVVRAARHVGRKCGKPVTGWWPARICYEERRRKGEAAVRGPRHPRSPSIEEHFTSLRAAAIRSVRSIDKRFDERAVGEH